MTAVVVKEEAQAEELALTIRSKIDALEVVDQDSYDLANAYNKQAYEGKKAFHAWFDPIDEASKKSRQATIAQGKKIDEPFDYVIKVTGSRAAAWKKAAEAKAEEEKRRIEVISRREAEEAQIRAAQALQEDGLFAAADEVMEAAPIIAKVVVATPDKAEGVYYQDRWSAEVVDLMALVKSVACGESSIAFLQPCESSLGSFARSMKGTVPIPGVRFLNTPIQGRRS